MAVTDAIDGFAKEWGLTSEDVRMYVCLRDVAHHAVLIRPHVAKVLEDHLVAYAGAFHVPMDVIEQRLGNIDPSDLNSFQESLGDPEVLFGEMQSEEQRRCSFRSGPSWPRWRGTQTLSSTRWGNVWWARTPDKRGVPQAPVGGRSRAAGAGQTTWHRAGPGDDRQRARFHTGRRRACRRRGAVRSVGQRRQPAHSGGGGRARFVAGAYGVPSLAGPTDKHLGRTAVARNRQLAQVPPESGRPPCMQEFQAGREPVSAPGGGSAANPPAAVGNESVSAGAPAGQASPPGGQVGPRPQTGGPGAPRRPGAQRRSGPIE